MVSFPRLSDFMLKIPEFGLIILHKAKQGTFVKYCGILVVWKSIYQNYLKAYPKAPFVELDLEGPFVVYIERTKNENLNEESSKWVTLQCDEVLKQLRTMNVHAIQNVLKKQQSFIDGMTH